MATLAEQRLLELLDKWLKSLELHAKYSSLDDDSYWKVQPWIEHQRPSRWIIDLAMQRTQALKTSVEERIRTGDAKFSDSLELMIFLANLVGSEHIERFIPVAEAENERGIGASPPAGQKEDPNAATGTREMPKLPAAKRSAPPAGTQNVARAERKSAGEKTQPKTAKQSAKTDAAVKEQVVADAVRLAQWGRKWFEMPELIARMAGRPPLAEVRRILKESKAAIDAQAKGA
ncbi:MAG TPA: hypothetical protein VHV81_12300 [Steroidobacteraceae bacterium]|jgi:hypothetical protein|nr:hypothetical protein [Steroidobacteraceae bacterium]